MASPPHNPDGQPTDRAQLGRLAEDRAVEVLQTNGARILLRNFRARCGELDIVALHQGIVLVVEVRCRSQRRWGGSAASVDASKRRRILRTTRVLLQRHPLLAKHPLRFDVMAADSRQLDTIEWIRHAFEAS
jgi:putative endonuclease